MKQSRLAQCLAFLDSTEELCKAGDELRARVARTQRAYEKRVKAA